LALCLPGHEDRNNSNKQKSRRYSCLLAPVFSFSVIVRWKNQSAMTVTVMMSLPCPFGVGHCSFVWRFLKLVTPVCPAGVLFGTPDSHYVMVRIIVRIFGAEKVFSHSVPSLLSKSGLARRLLSEPSQQPRQTKSAPGPRR
jgi:hypothetical protein